MTRKKGLGKEDILHKQTAEYLHLTLNKSVIRWSYDASGEKRSLKTGALLKAKGLKRGKPDFTITYSKKNNNSDDWCVAYYLHLEAKSPTGKQSNEQKKFEKSCECINENYYIYRSIDELNTILAKYNLLK